MGGELQLHRQYTFLHAAVVPGTDNPGQWAIQLLAPGVMSLGNSQFSQSNMEASWTPCVWESLCFLLLSLQVLSQDMLETASLTEISPRSRQ